jgi:hypothetical protein
LSHQKLRGFHCLLFIVYREITMKLTLIVLAAAALLAGPVASAHAQLLLSAGGAATTLSGSSTALQFLGGYGHLAFSDGNYDQINNRTLGGAVVTFNLLVSGSTKTTAIATQGTAGATVFVETQSTSTTPFNDAIAWHSPAVTTALLGPVGGGGGGAGQLGVLALQGGLSIAIGQTEGIAAGGSVQMSNLRVDLNNGQIIADLFGTSVATADAPSATYNSLNTVVWTAGAVSGPTLINAADLGAANADSALTAAGFGVVDRQTMPTLGTCIGGYPYYSSYPCMKNADVLTFRSDVMLNTLEMTPEATEFLINSLILDPTGNTILTAVNFSTEKWGSLAVGTFFRTIPNVTGFLPSIPASIPEPSTYALMGLGLLGIWGVSRRAARHPST